MSSPDVDLTIAGGSSVDVTIAEPGGVEVVVQELTTVVELDLAVPGIQGPPGERGPAGPGGGGYQEHVQTAPAREWTISHDFGRPPAVTVMDVDGNEIDAAVHSDEQTVIITLGPATAGRAHLT
ncbi:hypothetical protein [Nonomuraea glycinis]|uniref:hypothetical protein n=1 Tax=Nonomuraea glycinis TaxID=2047744 RepID=UPI0033AC34C5